MVVVEETMKISAETIRTSNDADELEKILETEMHTRLCDKMKSSLHDMALLDIEPQDSGDFEVKASVVLTTTQDMLTALQRLATRLKEEFDLSDVEVEEVLEIFESTGGF